MLNFDARANPDRTPARIQGNERLRPGPGTPLSGSKPFIAAAAHAAKNSAAEAPSVVTSAKFDSSAGQKAWANAAPAAAGPPARHAQMTSAAPSSSVQVAKEKARARFSIVSAGRRFL